ncbi:MAG: MFS transporter [Patescibacteria group bacterium]
MISKRNDTIFIVSQFFSALIFTIPIWIVFYQQRITTVQISLLVAVQYASQLILELPTGALADIFGRKWSVVAGHIAWALAAILLLTSHGFAEMLIAVIIWGLGDALVSGALEALVYDSHKQDGLEQTYSKVTARNSFWYQIGLVVAVASGGVLYGIWQGLPYVGWAATSVVGGIIALFFIEPAIDSARFTIRSYFFQMKRGLLEAFKSKSAAFMSLFYIAVAGITWTNNLYFFDFILVELGFADAMRGYLIGGIRLFNVFVLTAFLKNNHIFTRKRLIYFFPAMMLLCFLPGILFQGWWAVPFIAGAVMVGTGRWIVLTRYTNEQFDSKYRATAISALSMIVGVVYVVITSLSGPIIASYGVRMIYTILGVLTLITVLPLSIVLVGNQKAIS